MKLKKLIKKLWKKTSLYRSAYQDGNRAKNRLRAQGAGITDITMKQMVSEKEAEMHQELLEAKRDNGGREE